MSPQEMVKIHSVQVVEPAPKEPSSKVIEELIDLLQAAVTPAETHSELPAAHWFHRVPFPGVRYYSYE